MNTDHRTLRRRHPVFCRPAGALAAAVGILFGALPAVPAAGAATAVDAPAAAPADTTAARLSAPAELSGPTREVSVEFHEGTNMAAAPSPDGRRVAFTAQGALWLVPIEGGQATRLTPWTVEPTAPVWSPDGATIAFQNYTPEGNWHIWSVRPDGSDLRELTTGFFDDREPAWMPDGSALVFASDRSNDGQYKIWSFDLRSSRYAPLTRGAGAESNPALSSEGRTLAFVDANRVFTVALDAPDGASAPVAGGTAPAFVADGTAPAFVPRGPVERLVYQGANGTLRVGMDEVTNGEDLFPFPARALPGGGFLYTADGLIRTRDADGANPKAVPFSATLQMRRPAPVRFKDRHFSDPGSRPVLGIASPVLSPDARRIAFVALNDVWVMTIGERPVRLTTDADRDGSLQWTPDGKALIVSSEKGNGGALAVDRIEVDGGARTRLAAIAGKSMVQPSLSPDGRSLAYLALSGQLEVRDLASGRTTFLMPQVSTQLSTPQWLPDGRHILLVDNERVNNRFREGYNKLRVIDLDRWSARFHAVAEAPRQVSDREEGGAAVSPDGRRVAFVMDSLLHVMPIGPDGAPAGEAVAITREVADLPSWSGDSKTLLYKSGRRLRLVDVDGANARDVAVPLEFTQQTGPAHSVVHAGALWDGVSDALRRDVDVFIDGNRIVAIEPAGTRAVPAGAREIDARGSVVMPGLWDPHIHPLTLYQGGQYGQLAALMLSYGITSTQSVAGPLHQSIEIREALEAGNLVGPRLFVSPPLWEGNRLYYSFARTLRTPQIADLEIAKALDLDADFLKSYVRAPIPIMRRIAQAGLDAGIPTGTHMLSPGAVAGISGTTHLSATQRMGYGWSKSMPGGITYQDAVDLHAKADFHNIDTLFSSVPLVGQDPAFTQDDRFRLLVSPNFVEPLKKLGPPTPAQLALMKRDAQQSARVQQAGALMALGTDSPLVAPGIVLHTNLRAGAMAYPNVQALKNVTINAAKMAWVDHDLGSVEVGKLADLVVVDGDPLADLRNAAKVQVVIKNGVARTLDEILAPFRTPEARAQHEAAITAWNALCAHDSESCGQGAHAD